MSHKDILHYHLGDALGESPRGATYTALDSALQRAVAVKVLIAERPIDFDRRGRYLDLMDDLSRLHHPALGEVFSLEHVDGEYVLVRDYIEGLNLRDTMATQPLLYRRCLRIALELASALAEVFSRGAVCGLLHANNVIVGLDGHARLVDYALPAAVDYPSITDDDPMRPGLAPELRKNAEPDSLSDLYAFGAIVYEMLAGKPPDITSTDGVIDPQTLPYELASGEPMPSEARLLLERLLEPDPAERMPTVHELVATLEGMDYYLQHPPQPEEDQDAKGPRGRRALLLSAIAALLLIVWFVVTVFGD